MSLPPPDVRFRDNTIALAYYCRDIIVDAYQSGYTTIQPAYVNLGIVILENEYSAEKMINNFITYSYPSWNQILIKDEEFFDKNIFIVFKQWSKNVVNMFRELFYTKKSDGTSLITEEQKQYIWKVFHTLVKISLHYVHESRSPKRLADGSIKYDKQDVMPHVLNLGELINTWGVKNLRFV